MTGSVEKYKAHITSAAFFGCYVEMNPEILVAHDKALDIALIVYRTGKVCLDRLPFLKVYKLG
jgi:hypothetical protein